MSRSNRLISIVDEVFQIEFARQRRRSSGEAAWTKARMSVLGYLTFPLAAIVILGMILARLWRGPGSVGNEFVIASQVIGVGIIWIVSSLFDRRFKRLLTASTSLPREESNSQRRLLLRFRATMYLIFALACLLAYLASDFG